MAMLVTAICGAAAGAGPKVVELPGKSPLVTIRLVFLTGAARDPADRPGVAALTAAMLARGGTREMSYKQIVDALFPMAASVTEQTDKEMIVFSGRRISTTWRRTTRSSARCCSIRAGGRKISRGCATMP